MKNGAKGPAILLRRPKDATILKVHSNYKNNKNSSKSELRGVKHENVRKVKGSKPMMKEREKLVCPVCGILTYALGNHMATHQGRHLLFILNKE